MHRVPKGTEELNLTALRSGLRPGRTDSASLDGATGDKRRRCHERQGADTEGLSRTGSRSREVPGQVPRAARRPSSPAPTPRSERLYTPSTWRAGTIGPTSGLPGEYPYTRGVQNTMYRGRFWTMRQYAGFGTAEEIEPALPATCSSRARPGSRVAFDLPTQIGLRLRPPAAPAARWARSAWPSTRSRDMEILFDGIPLDKVSTSMTINATGRRPAGHVHGGGREAGRRRATSSAAPSRTTSSRSTSPAAPTSSRPRPRMRLITDIFAYCAERRARSGTPSPSPATTSARPARPRCRRWPSPSPTASPTSRPPSRPGLDVDDFAAAALLLLQRPQRPPRGGGQVPRRPPACGRGS
ncbi:MAG: methylmalonyl-CoA mutase family protein [Desulfomicrobium escambiense]|nr:methylmalonyl-CoA mutase family protein [Desulfomicrobium escambiense]